MKKYLSITLLLTLLVGILLTGCGKVDVIGVTLSNSAVAIKINETFVLTATVTPADASEPMVYWESSDTSVATVKSGVVTAVGSGQATITAFTKNGINNTCTVTVENVLTKKIKLDKSSFTMMVGATQEIHYTILPENVTDNTVSWESSNPKVAVVDKGKVTAKGVGSCVITASTENGVKAKCELIVKIKPTGVRVSKPTASLTTGDTLQLSAKVLPANTAYKNITWESSDEKIATVDSNGKVTAKTAGTCKIYATTSNNKYDYCTVTVTQGVLEFSGKGNDTLTDVNVTKGVYKIIMTHEGKGVFKVIGTDSSGGAYTYIDTKGNYTGSNLYANGDSSGVKNATIKVAATGKWTLKIEAIKNNGTDHISGTGDCVTPMFRGTNKKDIVKMKNEADGDFTIFLFDETGKKLGTLCDEIDNYDGSCDVTLDRNKYYFFVVFSQGKWTIDFGNKSSITTVSPGA
ncbi:MAG: Ig domain-containing protein [Ruminococcus sp.]|nr:Ig domain-containing protein [Ruminococcus sp.]